jgi:hypothetical protein
MTARRRFLVSVLTLMGAACTVDVTGAICDSTDNCPSGQFCSSAHKCVANGTVDPGVDGGTGGGGGGANDGGTGGGGGGGGTASDGGSDAGQVCGDGGLIDTSSDPANCGGCGHVCATPAHASATCRQSACGRGPCASGFFDVDGPATFGCESACLDHTCTFPDGGTLTVTNVPLPETRGVWGVVVNGTTLGDKMQANAQHTNLSVVGDVMPTVDGGIEARNSQYRHLSGSGSRAH